MEIKNDLIKQTYIWTFQEGAQECRKWRWGRQEVEY
jgi:hypothetical protein